MRFIIEKLDFCKGINLIPTHFKTRHLSGGCLFCLTLTSKLARCLLVIKLLVYFNSAIHLQTTSTMHLTVWV